MSHILNESLFSIRQIASASGLSRAMIIKLEEAGFLKPVKINPKNGYRYYDALSVSKLHQYKMMRDIQLSQQDIFNYYQQNLNPDSILEALNTRIHMMERFRDELALRHNRENNYCISEITLPASTAFCRTEKVDSIPDSYIFALNVHHEAIEKGFRISYQEMPFTERYDTETAGRKKKEEPYLLKICIPVDPTCKGREGTEFFPETKALSILYYGGFDEFNHMWKLLWDDFHKRKLTPAGKGRGIGVLFPYVDPELPLDQLTARFAIPVNT